MPESDDKPSHETLGERPSRRRFLKFGAAALGAASTAKFPAAAAAAVTPKPKRGGILRFATRSDAHGADPHKNLIYNVSQPLAATSQGLLDLAPNMEPAPGIARNGIFRTICGPIPSSCART